MLHILQMLHIFTGAAEDLEGAGGSRVATGLVKFSEGLFTVLSVHSVFAQKK